MRKNIRATRAARTLIAFFDVCSLRNKGMFPNLRFQLQREHSTCSKSYIAFISSSLYGAFSGVCQQYRIRTKSNNHQIVIIGLMFVFKLGFICRVAVVAA